MKTYRDEDEFYVEVNRVASALQLSALADDDLRRLYCVVAGALDVLSDNLRRDTSFTIAEIVLGGSWGEL